MNVSAWSIRHPLPSILLFAALSVAGLFAFGAAKVQNFPDVDLPLISVVATLPGMAPAQMEVEVARKLENALATLSDLRHLYTTIQDGVTSIAAEFRLEKAPQEALDDVRAAVARVRGDLPAALRDPEISKIEFMNVPLLTWALRSEQLDEEALSWFVDEEVTRRLLAVPGVGAVARVGGVSRELRVELDPERLLGLRLSAAELSRRLLQVQREAPGGRAGLGSEEIAVRTLVGAASAAELAALELPLPGERVLRLDQIARVSDTQAERRSAALFDGEPVVAFQVLRMRGAGDIAVAEGVRQALAELQRERPDITFQEAFNAVDPVQENFRGSLSLLVEGAVLAVLVVGLFLRDLRATVISALALPLSILPTFLFMQAMGFSLNVVTLLALSLVAGILVDDAIVEIENILRHLSQGKTPHVAAREAADEIGLAVIATSATLIAVFLPTAFMEGLAGKFFVQFGWTAAVAVFFSLAVARLLTPMLAARLLTMPARPLGEAFWMPAYLRVARWALTHKGVTLSLVAAFSLASALPLLSGAVQADFMPAEDLGQIHISAELPPGSSFTQTLAVAREVQGAVMTHPQVRQVFTAIGASGGSGEVVHEAAELRRADFTLSLSPRDSRPGLNQQQIEAELRTRLQDIAGVRIRVAQGETYTLVLAGEDSALLSQHAARVERELRSLMGIGQVSSSAQLQRAELLVRPDPARAADLGVSTEAIAEALRVATLGDYEQFLPKLNLAQRQLPIVLRLPEAATRDLDLLRQLSVPGARGPVPIRQVADLEITSGPAQISRLDRQRNVNFEIELNGQALSDVQRRAAALPSLSQLPPGLRKIEIGEAETANELGQGFVLAMGSGLLCIYLVLVLLFQGWLQPLTILGALLLSLPGAILALYLSGTHLSMPAMIGMVMLLGIAGKNSILLVDYAIVAQRQGLGRLEALLDACRKRARPIVMTSLAMGAGMLPIALGLGADAGFRAPMAIVVIGGLISSTVLSLLVIPLLYALLDEVAGKAHRRIRGPA